MPTNIYKRKLLNDIRLVLKTLSVGAVTSFLFFYNNYATRQWTHEIATKAYISMHPVITRVCHCFSLALILAAIGVQDLVLLVHMDNQVVPSTSLY